MSGLRTWGAFGLFGFELNHRIIYWEPDSERPTMVIPADCGRHQMCEVASRAFDVPPGPIAKRRVAMRKAALAFFAPLMEKAS